MKKTPFQLVCALTTALLLVGCQPGEVTRVEPLQNDLLKKTTGPAVVGDRIEFAYAIATTEGDLKNVRAEASIRGRYRHGLQPLFVVHKPEHRGRSAPTNGGAIP